MRNTDNTPGQMEATASTAEGKKRKPVYAGWDFLLSMIIAFEKSKA